MAVRFIIGRAGSGKTHRCLDEIRRRLSQRPRQGPRLLCLVPEQASLQMERAILEPAEGASSAGSSFAASHRAEVLSFRRLALRVLGAVGNSSRHALTDPARAMVIRHLLLRHRSQLRYYSRMTGQAASARGLAGFVDRLSAALSELMDEAVAPQHLKALVDGDPSASDENTSDPEEQAKLHDLHLIYNAYLQYLGDEKLDPSQYLQLARECIPECDWLCDAELWVDGFASFSGQEILTLIALARRARSTKVTVLTDPRLVEEGRRSESEICDAARLFARTQRTYRELADRFRGAGLDVEDPIVLSELPPARFPPSSAFADLERRLFSPSAHANPAPLPSRLELVELPSRRIEADYAVSRLCQWVQATTPLRYRDMAIIARELDPYYGLLSEALSTRGIPFFIDRRRPVTHHPLVELLRAAAGLAADPYALDSLRGCLKTGLLPIDRDASDALENYALAHGISAAHAWCGEDWSFPVRPSIGPADRAASAPKTSRDALFFVNRARRALIECLHPWMTFSRSSESHLGGEWVGAVQRWIESLGVGRTLKRWVDEAVNDGDIELADEHKQVWREVMSLLDDAAMALSDVAITEPEWEDLVESGLSRVTLGLVPPTLDQVLVGSIERSRHPDIKAVVLVGFNDGLFPKVLAEDAILNDDDRNRLKQAGLRIRPAARERTLDECLLAYVALTRASEALVVTYASADDHGAALRPSPYVAAMQAACDPLPVTKPTDPMSSRQNWDVQTPTDLVQRLAIEFRQRGPRAGDDGELQARWNALYAAVQRDLGHDPTAKWIMESLDEPREKRLPTALIERLYPGSLSTSVSRLESFAACPFQHFSRYTLRLRQREEASLEAVDVGQVHHAILEDFVGGLATQNRGFGQLTDAEVRHRLEKSHARVTATIPTDGKWSDARTRYKLLRSTEDLARVIQAQRRRSRSAGVTPQAVELPFGFDTQRSLDALELSTPTGRCVLLRGYIDRVDLVEHGDELLGLVIDYKTTRNKLLRAGDVYHGVSLQLLSYLLVLADAGVTPAGRRIRPIGALYLSLAPRYGLVDHPDHGKTREDAPLGTARPRGLVVEDGFAALDDAAEAGWSDHYAIYRKKDGDLGNLDHSDGADRSSFQAMLAHTRYKLATLADGILDGDVAISPFRIGSFSPCSWCAMPTVCRFDNGLSDVRFVEALTRTEALRRMREEGGR